MAINLTAEAMRTARGIDLSRNGLIPLHSICRLDYHAAKCRGLQSFPVHHSRMLMTAIMAVITSVSSSPILAHQSGSRSAYRAVAVEALPLYQGSMPARWFTDPAAAAPTSINPGLTAFEQLHLDAIIEFARNPANSQWENLRCLDAAGTRMHDMSVGLKAAPLTELMKTAMSGSMGVRQWHNHPSQDSLSNSDWECAGFSPDLEVLALNKLGSIFIGRIKEWDDRLSHVLPWLPSLARDLQFHMDRAAKKAGLSQPFLCALSQFTGHVLNSALAACSSVRYAYHLVSDDQAVIDACSELHIIEGGLAYARAAIKKRLDEAPAVHE